MAARRAEAPERKAALGRAAAALVRPGQVVFFDAGSTNAAIARALPAGLGVVVATNAPDIASDLVGMPGVELIVIGGRVDPRSGAALGARALRDVRAIRVDLAFLGACAVDARAGVAAFDAEEAEFKRLVAERAKAVVAGGDDRQARNGGAVRRRAGLAPQPPRRRSGRAGKSVGAVAPRRRQRPSRRARRRGDAMSGGVASVRSAAWSERAAVVAVFLANGVGIGAWAACIPALKARLALSDGALGFVLFAFAVGAVLLMQLAARLTRRLGPAKATRAAALLFGVALPLPAFAPDFATLVVAALRWAQRTGCSTSR